MQRVFDLLKDDGGPIPEAGEPVWVLGREYEVNGDNWGDDLLNDIHKLVWLMYRTQFATPIPRHPDGPSPLLQNMNAFLRSGPYAVHASSLVDSFTSDVGWGCMIRTGQSLLANALLRLLAKTNALTDSNNEVELLRKFTDDPNAVYSIHKFVEYGAEKCGKLPGQWFGPSAVAACIAKFAEPPLNVYISSGADIFEQDLLALEFPVLVLCGLRLGIQEVNPVYYPGLQSLLNSKQSVGIAGGRTSASHYFYGYQGTRLFYHDPHEPKPSLNQDSPDQDFLDTMHSRKIRCLNFSDMDPSMLAGFLLSSREEFEEWKEHFSNVQANSSVVNITNMKQNADFLDDLSDDEESGPGEQLNEDEEQVRELSPQSREDKNDEPTERYGSSSYVVCEPISQEAIVTVDVNEPGDESTIEITRNEERLHQNQGAQKHKDITSSIQEHESLPTEQPLQETASS